jgi:hypothetical protein
MSFFTITLTPPDSLSAVGHKFNKRIIGLNVPLTGTKVRMQNPEARRQENNRYR